MKSHVRVIIPDLPIAKVATTYITRSKFQDNELPMVASGRVVDFNSLDKVSAGFVRLWFQYKGGICC